MDAKEVVAHEPQNAPYLPSQDDFGPSVDLDAVAEDLGEAFFDERPADDWAAQLDGLTVCWVAVLSEDQADEPELTIKFAVDRRDRRAYARC